LAIILIYYDLATGATISADAAALKTQNSVKIVVVVPTAAPYTCEFFGKEANMVVYRLFSKVIEFLKAIF
jgi:predicted phosphoribosyltransferase